MVEKTFVRQKINKRFTETDFSSHTRPHTHTHIKNGRTEDDTVLSRCILWALDIN